MNLSVASLLGLGLFIGAGVYSAGAADTDSSSGTNANAFNRGAASKISRVDRVESDLKLLEKLLTKSSIAQATRVSGTDAGTDAPSEARVLFEKARQAHKDGNKELAAEYIRKAKQAMFAAGRKSGAGKSHQNKLEQDYKKRIRNVRALLDALKRIAQEKRLTADAVATEKQVLAKLDSAERQFDKGKLEDAKKTADEAFVLAKQFVVSMRDGDTLVRSLNFASKEEEYKYELDRNHTHNMLVTVLLKEKMSNPSVAKKVNKNMDKAEQLRLQAKELADKGKFAEAVETLENSTKQIIRAIRAAGIYIPG